MEEWRDIKGFEGLYQVSNYGRIKSLKRILIDGRIWYERIMKTPLSAGYPSISLRKDNTYFKERVHRVVGKTFIEGYQENYCINHINGIKTDNHISNLEWCTYSENSKHAYDTGLHKPYKGIKDQGNNKFAQEWHELIKQGMSFRKIGLLYNVSHHTVIRTIKKILKN